MGWRMSRLIMRVLVPLLAMRHVRAYGRDNVTHMAGYDKQYAYIFIALPERLPPKPPVASTY